MKISNELNKALKEKDQLNRCLSILYTSKVRAWRNNVGVARYDDKRTVRFGEKGTADILGYVKDGNLKGQFFAFEVKRFKGKATLFQQNFLENCNDAKCIVGIGTSNDLVDLLTQYNLH